MPGKAGTAACNKATCAPHIRHWLYKFTDKYNNEMIYAYIKKQLMLRFLCIFIRQDSFYR